MERVTGKASDVGVSWRRQEEIIAVGGEFTEGRRFIGQETEDGRRTSCCDELINLEQRRTWLLVDGGKHVKQRVGQHTDALLLCQGGLREGLGRIHPPNMGATVGDDKSIEVASG